MRESRRERRVTYVAKMRLRSPGRERSVVARVHNLSAGGAFVTAPELPREGSEVQCRLRLGGAERTLKGRVAWMQETRQDGSARPPAAGIMFTELTREDEALLVDALSVAEQATADRRSIEVWFDGLNLPIRCDARDAPDGIELTASLPFLRLGSQARLSLGAAAVDDRRVATVESLQLVSSAEDTVPRLRIGVTTASREERRPTPGMPPGGGDPALAARSGSVTAPASIAPRDATGAAIIIGDAIRVGAPVAGAAADVEKTLVDAFPRRSERRALRPWLWMLGGAAAGIVAVMIVLSLVTAGMPRLDREPAAAAPAPRVVPLGAPTAPPAAAPAPPADGRAAASKDARASRVTPRRGADPYSKRARPHSTSK